MCAASFSVMMVTVSGGINYGAPPPAVIVVPPEMAVVGVTPTPVVAAVAVAAVETPPPTTGGRWALSRSPTQGVVSGEVLNSFFRARARAGGARNTMKIG